MPRIDFAIDHAAGCGAAHRFDTQICIVCVTVPILPEVQVIRSYIESNTEFD
jgi:hypothetical protein